VRLTPEEKKQVTKAAKKAETTITRLLIDGAIGPDRR